VSDTFNSFGTFYSLNKNSKKNSIVFVHGVGLTHEMWKPQIDFFSDYTTLTYDLLGHGKTPLNKSKITFKHFADQLLNLINELKLNKIHLVGFSLGALIAREFASKYSDKLHSLILLGSIYKRSEEQKKVVINRFNLAKTNRSIAKKSALQRWLTDDFISKNPKTLKKLFSTLENNNYENFFKCYELFAHYEDDDNIIRKINVKTLVSTGENDIGSTTEMSRNLSKLIRGSQFIEIKNGKHLCSTECANDVNMIFKQFIEKNNDRA